MSKAESLHRRHRESNLFRHQTERTILVSPHLWREPDFSKNNRFSDRTGCDLGPGILVP